MSLDNCNSVTKIRYYNAYKVADRKMRIYAEWEEE